MAHPTAPFGRPPFRAAPARAFPAGPLRRAGAGGRPATGSGRGGSSSGPPSPATPNRRGAARPSPAGSGPRPSPARRPPRPRSGPAGARAGSRPGGPAGTSSGGAADPARDPDAFFRGRRSVGTDGTTPTAAGPATTQAESSPRADRARTPRPGGPPAGTGRAGRRLAARLLRRVPAGAVVLGDRNPRPSDSWAAAARRGSGRRPRIPPGPGFPAPERFADGHVRVVEYEVECAGRLVRGHVATSPGRPADGPAREAAGSHHRRGTGGRPAAGSGEPYRAGRRTRGAGRRGPPGRSRAGGRRAATRCAGRSPGPAARPAGRPRRSPSTGRSGFSGASRRPADGRPGGRPVARRGRNSPRVRKAVRRPGPVERPHHVREKPEPLRERLKIVPEVMGVGPTPRRSCFVPKAAREHDTERSGTRCTKVALRLLSWCAWVGLSVLSVSSDFADSTAGLDFEWPHPDGVLTRYVRMRWGSGDTWVGMAD